MGCTTILVGKKASYDGSTMAARNDDGGATSFREKKFAAVLPEEQPRLYRSVISHAEIPLPEDPMRYTAMPNAVPDQGVWAACGVNSANIAMTATETITSNERVLAADPLVRFIPAADGKPEKAGGIGEEDMVVLVLPYIRSAREGVLRLGSLLERYGTYEMNGIAFQDADEIWWLESVGGHHWMARRVPDDAYVVMPNQLGIDDFDFEDAMADGREFLCCADLPAFVRENHLDLSLDGRFNARWAFGSHSDADHTYNTPRAWWIQRFFNPHDKWEGPDAAYTPSSDDIPWMRVPERKITPEDVKYALSGHYQGTPYDPYGRHGDGSMRNAVRSIGVNRTNFMGLTQIRPGKCRENCAVEWIAVGSNVHNAMIPLFTQICRVPDYIGRAGAVPDTSGFYWANRIIAALADPYFAKCASPIERYQNALQTEARALVLEADRACAAEGNPEKREELCMQANEEVAALAKRLTDGLLSQVLFEATLGMKNAFARSDA